jgi:hypothetical protein
MIDQHKKIFGKRKAANVSSNAFPLKNDYELSRSLESWVNFA